MDSSLFLIYGSKNKEVETEIIYDDAKGQYMLLDIGWRDDKRAFNPIIYVRRQADADGGRRSQCANQEGKFLF